VSVFIVCVTQAREKISFNDFYAPPDSNGTVLSRKKYDEICHTLLMCVPKEDGGDPLDGVPAHLKAHCKLLMTKWQRFVMVGGAIQLRRCRGPMPEFHHALTGEWPKVTCVDEIFDVLWDIHHQSGHVKTPATLHGLAVERGLWGIPREACRHFVLCCLVCSMSKRIMKTEETCKPIYAATYNERVQMDLIGKMTLSTTTFVLYYIMSALTHCCRCFISRHALNKV
jgi:hypothetical protein